MTSPKSRSARTPQRVEGFLREALSQQGGMEIRVTRTEIATRLGASVRSIQRAHLALVASGRWSITSGTGHSPTAYRYLGD